MRIKQRFDKNKIHFTSDPHFYHSGILRLMNRPYDTVEDMNEGLIANWNEVVAKDDIVFVCGDLIFTGKVELIKELVERLNGTIYWIYGNHDYQNKHDRPVVQELFGGRVFDILEIEVDDEDERLPKANTEDKFTKVFLCHYPLHEWNRRAIHAHGHVHSKDERQILFNALRYDVGVDNNNYRPISWFEFKEAIINRLENGE